MSDINDINDMHEQPGGRGEGLPASPGQEKWLGGRKWTGIAAVAVLALALLVAGVVVFSDTRPPPASSPAATSANLAGTGGSGGSASTAPGGQPQTPDQAIPSAPPAGVTWPVYQHVGVPVSATAGPARVVRSVAAGYAHSPSGALLAAANLSTRLPLAPDTEWREAALTGAVDTPTRQKWLDGRGRYQIGQSVDPRLVQIRGFQVQGYSAQQAQIWLVSGGTQGFKASLTTVRWSQGDWKLVMDGGFVTSAHAVADLTGFVPWAGVA